MTSIKHLNSLFALFIAMLSFAQPTNEEGMKAYLNANGTLTYYSDVIDRFFDFMKSEYQNQNVPDEVWTSLMSEKEQALNHVTEMITQAYQGHFSKEELSAIVNFYTSPTGEKIMHNADLSHEDVRIRDDFYGSPIGGKIESASTSLNSVIQKITQEWSAGLFRRVSSQLEAKGFRRG